MNDNEHTVQQKLWNTVKFVQRSDGNGDRSCFLRYKMIVDGDCSHELNIFAPWKKSFDKPRQHIKKQRPYLLTKSIHSQQ